MIRSENATVVESSIVIVDTRLFFRLDIADQVQVWLPSLLPYSNP